MADLAAFLTARLDAEQQLAEDAAVRAAAWDIAEQSPTAWGDEAPPAQILAGGKPIITFGAEYGSPLAVDHVAYWDPARVLAEIAAKRAILAGHEGIHRCDYGEHRGAYLEPCTLVKQLAAPYADHPDFDPGWRAC